MSKTLFITGASDGIGKAVAWEMARRGYDLALSARRLELLEALQQDIQQALPQCRIHVEALDVTDTQAVAPVLARAAQALGRIDVVMANAGIARAGKVGPLGLDDNCKVIDTNVNGAIATVVAALDLFRQQGGGHLVGVSSVAAFRGLPGNAAYCASKAALSTFLEAVRAETLKEPIDITVLHPGFIDTEINRAMPSRPFVIDVEKGAAIIADLIEKKVRRSTVPPMPWGLVGRLLKVLPTSVVAKAG